MKKKMDRRRIWKQVGEVLTVASITKTLSQSSTAAAAAAAKLLPSQSPQLLLTESVILKVLSNPSLSPSQKLHFFNSSRSHKPHSPSAYSLIFRTLCHNNTLDHLPSLLHSMMQDGVVLDSHYFKLLFNSLISSDNFNLALHFLDYMQQRQTTQHHLQPLTPLIYNSLLIASIRNNQLPLALSIFHNALPSNSISISASNHLLSALRKAGMKSEFQQVFHSLMEKKKKNEDFSLDSWFYNICIHAFGSWGDLVTSFTLFKEMKEDKNLFGPDLCTYNTLISVLCRLGKLNDALVVWEEFKGCGHEPDDFSYTILIQGCSRTCRIDEAMRIFNEMQGNGFRPGTLVYNSLLDGLFKAAKVVEVCQLFEKAAQEGVKPSCSTYNILIH